PQAQPPRFAQSKRLRRLGRGYPKCNALDTPPSQSCLVDTHQFGDPRFPAQQSHTPNHAAKTPPSRQNDVPPSALFATHNPQHTLAWLDTQANHSANKPDHGGHAYKPDTIR